MFGLVKAFAVAAHLAAGSSASAPVVPAAFGQLHDAEEVIIVLKPRIAPDAVACKDLASLLSYAQAVQSANPDLIRAALKGSCSPLLNMPYAMVERQDDVAQISPIDGSDWAVIHELYTFVHMLRLEEDFPRIVAK